MPQTINVIGPFNAHTGYGTVTEYVALSLKYRCDLDVKPCPLNLDFQEFFQKHDLSQHLEVMFMQSLIDKTAPSYFHFHPDQNIINDLGSNQNQNIIHTVYESEIIPEYWVPILNKASFVIVPSDFLVPVFQNSGVQVPVHRIYEGIDPAIYHHRPRRRRETFSVGLIGPFIPRKNHDISIAAWKQVFANNPNTFLKIQGSYRLQNYTPDHPNIYYTDRPVPGRSMVPFYDDIDLLVAIGSEGFGLPLVEALALGCPVIAMDEEGQHDTCKELQDLIPTVKGDKFVPHDCSIYENVGNHWVPKADDLAKKLIDVYENLEQYIENGKQTSQWAIQNRNIWDFGPQLVALMEKYRLWT